MAVFVTFERMPTTKASPRGTRYTNEQKAAIVDFVLKHNQENGRGGQSAAVRKFGVSPLSIGAWVSGSATAGASGSKSKAKTKVGAKSGGSLAQRVAELVAVGKQIELVDAELTSLRARLASLKSSL